MATISTIITAYDHHDITTAHVKHSMDVTRVPDEIIVVNDGGDPSLRDMLKALDKKCPIIYARIKEDIPWNYHGACNLAVWLSKGDLLAFEDNDNIPSPDFYRAAHDFMRDNPDYGRVQASGRVITTLDSILNKPRDEWEVTGKMGPNMGTAVIRRSTYLQVKGQDERFCGRYGFMYYDWRSRLLKVTKFKGVGSYFYIHEGQSYSDKRSNSRQNFGYYRDNAKNERIQHPEGILNFSYEFEEL